MCVENEKLKLKIGRLKRQLERQESEFTAKLEKSWDDLQQAFRLKAQLQEALVSKDFVSIERAPHV